MTESRVALCVAISFVLLSIHVIFSVDFTAVVFID